jgi:hypothetical protein
VLHIHTIVEECEVTKLVHAVDMKTKEPKKVSCFFKLCYFDQAGQRYFDHDYLHS